jgi:hypothetical protein
MQRAALPPNLARLHCWFPRCLAESPAPLAESSGESGLRTPERRSGPVAASRCPWWRLPIASGGGESSLLTSGGMAVCLRRRREENKRERATLLTTVYVAQIAKWLAHSLSML